MNDIVLGYTGLNACTIEPNSSYISNTHIASHDPMSGTTMGLMMLMSTFQYQAPYMGPTYSNAMAQASKAAFIQSGGQTLQDNLGSAVAKNATTTVHSIGVTDAEMGIVFEAAKIARSRQIDVNGPRIYVIKTHLTLGQDNGSIGLKYEF